MKTMRITDHEEEMIMEQRKVIHHKKATIRFRKRIFPMALEYAKYLDENEIESSFNEFINCFNPKHDPVNNRIDYEAILKIIETVESLEIPKGK